MVCSCLIQPQPLESRGYISVTTFASLTIPPRVPGTEQAKCSPVDVGRTLRFPPGARKGIRMNEASSEGSGQGVVAGIPGRWHLRQQKPRLETRSRHRLCGATFASLRNLGFTQWKPLGIFLSRKVTFCRGKLWLRWGEQAGGAPG